VRRIADIELTWGESARWDDRRGRLWFVDCAARTLHWWDGGGQVGTMAMPGLPAGVVLTEGDEVVVCLDDGLNVVDAGAGSVALLAPYPEGLRGRANDANADGGGGLVTGTLNLGPGAGGVWRWSPAHGWTELDDDVANTNGPVVTTFGAGPDGEATLVVADTVAGALYAYPYDAERGTVGERRVLATASDLGGPPDGAAVDALGGVWSCALGAGRIVRLGPDGVDRAIDVPMTNPSDVTFGGPGRETMFVTAIALDLVGSGAPLGEAAHWLGALDAADVGVAGAPERRVALG